MTKLIELFNALMKYKLIKRPKCFLILIFALGILGIPKYTNVVIEKGLKSLIIEQSNITNKLIKHRANISSEIDKELKDLGHRVGADRVFLGEFSNTITGTSGLHFLYFTINNEYDKAGVSPIATQYQKQNCFNFKSISNLIKNKTLCVRDIEDLKDTDPVMYTLIKKNTSKQLFMMYFEIDEVPIGFIGISYENETHCEDNKLMYELSISLRRIRLLFDYKK